ncbi:MAG TPA: glycosyl hydrolase family 28 protein [Tepidisphaeraceae bacterium]|jgi:polygalacturonase|nr:glycosyl hydrolase family 28 protein [Tepidisphaeraceae bacterium]
MINTRTGLALLAICWIQLAKGEDAPRVPALPQIPEGVLKITDHGAVADEKTDNAKAIQETIDAAVKAGGGVVEVPAGEYLAGPFRLDSEINLHLDAGATLKMLPIDRYPGGTRNPQAFITGRGLHDVVISGEGTIDGEGAPWWPLVRSRPGIQRPRMIALSGCDKILIEKVRLQNSPMFHIAISGHSTNVTVRGVTIRAPASTDPVNPSHNTDACDVSGSHVLIEDCDVSVGDDNFTCGGGTSDVHIRHCTYGNGHGVSIGSPTSGGVSDITVEDCTFTDTDCGIRIKSDRGRGGVVQRMTYRNLKMTNVGFPILIYGSYAANEREYRDLTNLTPAIATTYPSRPMSDRTPVFKDITFTNITATAAAGHRAGLIWGLPEAPASNIVLQNVSIKADKPMGIYSAQGVKLVGCKIVTPEGENKLSTVDAEVTVSP